MSFIYQNLIYKPLLNLLVFLYNTVSFGDLGVAIILLTVIIRFVLFPLFKKSAEYQRHMRELQPKIKKIQEKYKEDKIKQTEEVMAAYKEKNLNPFSGFLFLLIQLPVLFALYQIFLKILQPSILDKLYPFINKPEALNPSFLGLINLGHGSILMVVLAALGQYFSAKLMMPKGNLANDPSARMAKQMMFIGPVLTLLIFYKLPAAVSLYWVVASLFSIGQELILNRQHDSKLEPISE